MNTNTNPHDSSLGISANVVAMLAYLVTFIFSCIPIIKYVAWFAPLILFFVEKNSGFVKYHSMQAFLLNVVNTILTIVSGLFGVTMGVGLLFGGVFGFVGVTLILGIVFAVISIALLVYTIIAMVKAYGYQAYQIPVIGGIAANITGF